MGDDEMDWGLLLTIVLIEAGLSWDNVAINYAIVKKLPQQIQGKVLFWGMSFAIILRVALLFVSVWLLDMPYLKTIGGLWILWVAFKLLVDSDEEEQNNDISFKRILTAGIALGWTDLSMSFDNGVASAGLAGSGHMTLLLIAVALTIPIFLLGVKFLQWLMSKLPQVMYIISALLAWVGMKMIMEDAHNLARGIVQLSQQPLWIPSVIGIALVLSLAIWVNYRENRARKMV
jgi:YjbE family integral membrane protein